MQPLKVIDKFVSLIPYELRLAVYHTPLLPLGRLIFSKFMPSNTLVKITAGPAKGLIIYVNLKCQKYYWLGTYEPSVQETLIRIIKPGYVCYDIGAHVGYLSLIMARATGHNGKIIAFEPDPGNFSLLNKNIQVNNLRNNIKTTPIAISSKSGNGVFKKGLDTSTGKLSTSTSDTGIKIKITSLDDFVYEQDHLKPDLVKIDVEGFESEVISGAAKLLAKTQPIILCELHALKSAEEVYENLKTLGYSIFHIEGGLRPVSSPEFDGHWIAYPPWKKISMTR